LSLSEEYLFTFFDSNISLFDFFASCLLVFFDGELSELAEDETTDDDLFNECATDDERLNELLLVDFDFLLLSLCDSDFS